MGRNLGPLNIKDSYEGLVQISGSQLTDGSGSLIPSLDVSASYATSASYAETATSASYATTASFAESSSADDVTLQQVTDNGNTTTNRITADGFDATLGIGNRNYSNTSISTNLAGQTFSITGGSTVSKLVLTGNGAGDNIIRLNGADGLIQMSGSIESQDGITAPTINATTALTASGLIYPTVDGTVGQVVTTDGSGNLTLEDAAGGDAFPYTGSAEITGSLAVTGSVDIIGQLITGVAINTISATNDDVAIIAGNNVTISGGGKGRATLGGEVITLGGGDNSATIGGWVNANNSGARGVIVGGDHLTLTGGRTNVIIGGSYGTIDGGGGNTIIGPWGTYIYDAETDEQKSKIILNSPYSKFRGTASGTTKGYGKQVAIIASAYSEVLGDSGNSTDFSGILFSTGSTIPANSNNRVIIGGQGVVTNADNTVYVPNLQLTGSGATLTFDDGTTQTTAAAGGAAFPYTGSADITGSLNVIGNAVIGDPDNIATGLFSAVIGGGRGAGAASDRNEALGFENVVIGGHNNVSNGDESVIVGGKDMTVNGAYAAIIGGRSHNVTGQYGIAVGGSFNTVGASGAATLGGNSNTTNFNNSVVVGGNGLSTTKASEVVVPNLTIKGQVIGDINSITIASTTGSMDCSVGNFFDLTLAATVDTHLVTTNITAGQTISLFLKQDAVTAGTISFSSDFIFEGGTAFTASTGLGAKDVMTFISDGVNLFATGLKNFS